MRTALVVATALLVAGPVSAQVRLGTNGEGRRVLYNDPDQAIAAPERLAVPHDELVELIEYHAVGRGLDPLLVRALIEVESGYDAAAVSHKGAMGLMQLMPMTAAELAVTDPFDPAANIQGGTQYLRQMLDTFDNKLPLALAGYNAGPEAVRRYGGIPPYEETREYVRRVLRLYQGADFVDIPEAYVSSGRRTYLVRKGGRLVMTTTPPERR